MSSLFVPGLLGALLIFIGVRNMKGDISSIHWYHRQRVTEEDRKPFGRQVGLGTVIIGVALLITGCAIIITGIVGGLVLSFRAMIKYNKGIF